VKYDFHTAKSVARSTFFRSLSFGMCSLISNYCNSKWKSIAQYFSLNGHPPLWHGLNACIGINIIKVYCESSKENCVEWNRKREDKYNDELYVLYRKKCVRNNGHGFYLKMNDEILFPRIGELIMRFEAPDSKNRWDSPLFTIQVGLRLKVVLKNKSFSCSVNTHHNLSL
jgi:hypothetical protein